MVALKRALDQQDVFGIVLTSRITPSWALIFASLSSVRSRICCRRLPLIPRRPCPQALHSFLHNRQTDAGPDRFPRRGAAQITKNPIAVFRGYTDAIVLNPKTEKFVSGFAQMPCHVRAMTRRSSVPHWAVFKHRLHGGKGPSAVGSEPETIYPSLG